MMGDEADYLNSQANYFDGPDEQFNFGDHVNSYRIGFGKIVGCIESEELNRYGAGRWISDHRGYFDSNDFDKPIYIVRYSKGKGRKRGSREALCSSDELTLIESCGKKVTALCKNKENPSTYSFNCNTKDGKIKVNLILNYEAEEREDLFGIALMLRESAIYLENIGNQMKEGGQQ